MTYLALNFRHFVNGVAMRHGEVSRQMFADTPIDAITNGVHAETWVSRPFAALFDRHIPGWRRDNFNLRYASRIPEHDVWAAHLRSPSRGCSRSCNASESQPFDPGRSRIGFARRATAYKRADLLVQRPRSAARGAGARRALQIVFAGKAHPHDEEGKGVIERVFRRGTRCGRRSRSSTSRTTTCESPRVLTAGVRPLAQHAAAAARSVRHQRHEGRAQRRAEPERARRMVARGARRGRHRLGDRQRRAWRRTSIRPTTPLSCPLYDTLERRSCRSSTDDREASST